MAKNIIVKVVILLVVSSLSYSVFWFFKIGQIEKQISKFIGENSNYLSAGNIETTGFPLRQKISIKNFKFRIPNVLLNKKQITVGEIAAETSIFSNEFEVDVSGGFLAQDISGNNFEISFASAPKINFSVLDGRITEFSYQDFGYSITDSSGNKVYSSSASKVNIISSLGKDSKIKTRIVANIKDVSGFDVVSIYKNVLEEKVLKGINTGTISVQTQEPEIVNADLEKADNKDQILEVAKDKELASDVEVKEEIINDKVDSSTQQADAVLPSQDKNPVANNEQLNTKKDISATAPKAEEKQKPEVEVLEVEEKNSQVNLNEQIEVVDQNIQKQDDLTKQVSKDEKVQDENVKEEASAVVDNSQNIVQESEKAKDIAQEKNINSVENKAAEPEVIADSVQDVETIKDQLVAQENSDKDSQLVKEEIKSNFVLDVEYVFIPNKGSKNSGSNIPFDPTKIQELPVQYSLAININKLEFANKLYTILVKGNMTSSPDDPSPSGQAMVKIENMSSIVAYFNDYIADLLAKKGIDVEPVVKEEVVQEEVVQEEVILVEEQEGQLNTNSTQDEAVSKLEENLDAAIDVVAQEENTDSTNQELVADSSENQELQLNDEQTNQVVSEESEIISADLSDAIEENKIVALEPYDRFLLKVYDNLDMVTTEIAAKSPASKDDVGEFHLKREKNLEFIINQTTLREILGKFGAK